MDSFLFALGAVTPIVLMVLVGYFLKTIGWMNQRFAKEANKLVFRVFMPVMLFLNIYRIKSFSDFEFGFILYVVIALLLIFLVFTPLVKLVTKQKNRHGVLVQAAYRSGYSLIGIPLAESLYGAAGAIAATLLSAAVIPLFNVLAVICLADTGEEGKKPSVSKIVLDILKNPLIIGIAAGLAVVGIRALFVRWGVSFRLADVGPFMTFLQYISNLAIPMALLVLGAQFEFSAVSAMRREIIFGTVVRVVVIPLVFIGIALLFFRDKFSAAHFACFVSVFATPVAVTSVPMAQEMGGDVTLAGQLVVWSTLVSALTVFLFTFVLRLLGAF